MFALKAAVRLVPASSQLSAASRSPALRSLATDASTPTPDVHEVQGKERARSIRKVSEEGGAHSQLVALAVKNTAARAAAAASTPAASKEKRLEQAKRQLERRKAEASSSSSSKPPRTPQRSSAPPPRPRRSDGEAPSKNAPAPFDAVALLRGTPDRRPFNPRFAASPANAGDRPRPRRTSASPPSSSSPSSSNNKPRTGGPKKNRRTSSAAGSSSASPFSPEDSKPLVPPPGGVAYPAANLAQLVRADLAAKALAVKRAVSATPDEPVDVDAEAEDADVRLRARKVLTGDYSQWAAAAAEPTVEGKGKKDDAVHHARTLLARNPSVGLHGREVLINKLKEVL